MFILIANYISEKKVPTGLKEVIHKLCHQLLNINFPTLQYYPNIKICMKPPTPLNNTQLKSDGIFPVKLVLRSTMSNQIVYL